MGISSYTPRKEIFESYLVTANSILTHNKVNLSFSDRLYLYLEIFSVKYMLKRNFKDLAVFILLLLINLNNFESAAQVKGLLFSTLKKW